MMLGLFKFPITIWGRILCPNGGSTNCSQGRLIDRMYDPTSDSMESLAADRPSMLAEITVSALERL